MNPLLVSIYYRLKPLIPRPLQLAVRKSVIRRQRERFRHVWPIDESAGNPPENWRGWPDGKKFALVLTHDVDTEQGSGEMSRTGDAGNAARVPLLLQFRPQAIRGFPGASGATSPGTGSRSACTG